MALWGGHYCRHCGIELDKWGRQIGEFRTQSETESSKSLTVATPNGADRAVGAPQRNKIKALRVFEVIAAMMAIVLAGYTVLLAREKSASSRLLDAIQSITPGQKIEDVRMRLGHEMNTISDPDEMISIGSVNDISFCSDKILYWFYISTPPCRVVEVYTDKNRKVAFVTLQGL
jgi:hypothetical protein